MHATNFMPYEESELEQEKKDDYSRESVQYLDQKEDNYMHNCNPFLEMQSVKRSYGLQPEKKVYCTRKRSQKSATMLLKRKQSMQSMIYAVDDATEFGILTNVRAIITRLIMILVQNSITFTFNHLICIESYSYYCYE